MDSDNEILLMQNTFSTGAFFPWVEFGRVYLVGDFREVSEQDSVEVEKKENPRCNIVVVCAKEVEKRSRAQNIGKHES